MKARKHESFIPPTSILIYYRVDARSAVFNISRNLREYICISHPQGNFFVSIQQSRFCGDFYVSTYLWQDVFIQFSSVRILVRFVTFPQAIEKSMNRLTFTQVQITLENQWSGWYWFTCKYHLQTYESVGIHSRANNIGKTITRFTFTQVEIPLENV